MDWKLFLLKQLKRHEGFRSQPYRCSAGVWTIGFGHTLGVTSTSPEVTREQAEDMLELDMSQAIKDAKVACPCFNSLDPVRKVVIANMSFNLGLTKLKQFKRTLRAVCAGKYPTAGLYMMQSLWARQVKGRALELSKMMSTGKVPDAS